ncbi:hypothetical protein O3P69_002701 [Scylla paramamosain]|uniref:Nose resistant-to-fluoxetine protein N-terminal domain-containing protein n=1 Tax=Scylla paramamosain TaxID=85552 RepID=A0AAW0UQ38_SCYPA
MTSAQTTFLDLVQLYLPDLTKVNPHCRRDLTAIYTAMAHLDILIPKGKLWPLQLVDSWGKFGDGILVGNLKQLGFFEECLDIRVFQPSSDLKTSQKVPLQPLSVLSRLPNAALQPHNSIRDQKDPNRRVSFDLPSFKAEERSTGIPPADFSGQYCLVTYASTKEELEPLPDLRTPAVPILLPQALAFMAYGTCMPSTCTPQELQETVNEALQEAELKVSSLDCQVKNHRHPLQGSEISGIVLLAVLTSLLVVAACADQMTLNEEKQHLREGPLRYLLAFSITSNLQKMMHLETRKLPGVIPSIHAIRFLSIGWVVLGHQCAYSIQRSQNVADLRELTKPAYAQIMTNADLSVDTFFTLSGLLVTLGLLGVIRRTGRFNLFHYFLHRLLRLWPPVVLSVLLVATVSGLAVTGPYAEQYWSSVVKGCRQFWWMDISLTTNLIYPHGSYFHMEKGETARLAWLGFWTAASVITPAAIIGAYHLWPASLQVVDPHAHLQYVDKVYMMPWCRAGPYLVGVWAGYFIYCGRSNPSVTHLRPWQRFLGWGVAVGVLLAVLFGIAPYNYVGMPSEVPHMSTAEAVLYGGVHRAAWGAAVSWVIVACTWGYGGPVAYILEHPIWQPFSRLSYCIYLTSLPIQYVVLYSTKRPTFYSFYNKVQETAGVMLMIMAISVLVSLISESPILRLEKILLRRPTGEWGVEEARVRRESEMEE